MLDEYPGLQFVANDDRRHQCDALALSGEKTQHGHVVDLGENGRPDSRQFENPVKRHADIAIEAREEERLGA